MKRMTQEEFIQKSIQKHGNVYDYSLVKYINIRTNVEIICPKHGSFWQRPDRHLNGSRCDRCFGTHSYTKEDFIKNAKKIHEDKYDYSLIEYKNNITKVKITCPIHGIFIQRPNAHLMGCGCPKCSNNVYSTEEFIKRANLIFGNKYIYINTEIYNSTKKIEIICPKHGPFFQSPNNHLSGHGCPICKSSRGEIKIFNFLLKNEEEFKCEFRIENCKNKKPLIFDFVVYKNNNMFLIEYDGIQHYKPIDIFGGEDGLKETQKRDEIKTNYCITNNIPLLRIKYTDYDDIENSINEFLKEK